MPPPSSDLSNLNPLDNFLTDLVYRLNQSIDENDGGTGFADFGILVEVARNVQGDRRYRMILKGHPCRCYVFSLKQFKAWTAQRV